MPDRSAQHTNMPDRSAQHTKGSHGDGADVDDFAVVGIGASAGGLDALARLLKALPAEPGMAFVIVQHLARHQESDLSAILQRASALPVEAVHEEVQVLPDHVYVIVPNAALTLQNGRLHLQELPEQRRYQTSIDTFFESLAFERGERAVGVVLSGTGSDGARGLVAIKQRHGLTMVQAPDEAEYESMPQHAIETGAVDLILPVDEIARRLPAVIASREADEARLDDQHDVLADILAWIHERTGHDFSRYKRASLLRRIARRVQLHRLSGLDEYLSYLGEHPHEVEPLFQEMLINVTGFFRDPNTFEALQEQVLADLVARKVEQRQELRVWVAGCSTGEEAYSLAMLLSEQIRHHSRSIEVQIFATDIDREAIATARRGRYPRGALEEVSRQRRERFFVEDAGGWRVTQRLRDMVLFAEHDLLSDPPFARQDLISCRNVLIYLDSDAQEHLFGAFHYALRSDGYLFLGTAETPNELFTVVDKGAHIYQSRADVPANVPKTRATHAGIGLGHGVDAVRGAPPPRRREDAQSQHRRQLIEDYAPASLLIDESYRLLSVQGRIEPYLRVPQGAPSQDVLEVIRPSWRLELRTALFNTFESGEETIVSPLLEDEGDRRVRLRVRPMPADSPGATKLAIVTFEDGGAHGVDEPIARRSEELEGIEPIVRGLESELESCRRRLYETIDEYETATEEFKATNEELLTINEELQSTGEELETSKEELQSINEELTTVNDELQHKNDKLDEVNSDLKNLLSATDIGTIFLDLDLCIKRFTHTATNLFNLLGSDVGRPLDHITHQLDYAELNEDMASVLASLEPVEREVRTHQDDWYLVRVLPYHTVDDEVAGVVVTLFDITERKRTQMALTDSEMLFRTVFESASDALYIFQLDGDRASTFMEVNDVACSRLDYSRDAMTHLGLSDIVAAGSADVTAFLHTLSEAGEAVVQWESVSRTGDRIPVEVRARAITIEGEETVLAVSRDVTRQKEYERALLSAKEESDRLAQLRASFLANMSHEIRTPLTSIIGLSQLLGKNLADREQQMARLIRSSGQRLQQTLESVLDLSRLESGEMVPRFTEVEAVSEIADSVEMFRPACERKGLELRFEANAKQYTLVTDPGYLNRIVYNLVDNAVKFTKEGQVCVELQADGDQITLTISDTGIGIDEEFLPTLFDKFKRESDSPTPVYAGAGLGMTLVKHLIEALGATISVESTRGQGATFEVVVPDRSAALAEASDAGEASEA